MKKDRKIIRDTFLYYQRMYFKRFGDRYTAVQMAAIATREDFGLSKDELIVVLNNETV